MELFEINITILVVVLFLIIVLIIGLGIWQFIRITNKVKATTDDLTNTKAMVKAEDHILEEKTTDVSKNLGKEITTRAQADEELQKQNQTDQEQIDELMGYTFDLHWTLVSAFDSIGTVFINMSDEIIKQEGEIDTIQHQFIQEEQQRKNAYDTLTKSVNSVQNNLVSEEQQRKNAYDMLTKSVNSVQNSIVSEEQQRKDAYSLLNQSTNNLQNSVQSLDKQFSTMSASLQGTQKVVNSHINATGGLSGTDLTLNTGIQVTNSDPGPLIEKKYNNNSGDRYGVGQFNNGQTRLYTASAYGGATANIGFANSDNTFNDVLTVGRDGGDNMANTATIKGKLRVQKGNGDWNWIEVNGNRGDTTYLGSDNTNRGIWNNGSRDFTIYNQGNPGLTVGQDGTTIANKGLVTKGNIQTQGQLCVGATCINETQFKTLAK